MDFHIAKDDLREMTTIKINANQTIEDIINRKKGVFKDYLICPFGQLDYDQNNERLYTLENCRECGICEMNYNKFTNVDNMIFTNFDSLLAKPSYLSFFLDKIIPTKKHYPLVSVEGYSRDMRIDIVQESDNNYTLIKLIGNDKQSLAKYIRGYTYVCDRLAIKYPNIGFKIKFLSAENDISNNIITINRLIKENE